MSLKICHVVKSYYGATPFNPFPDMPILGSSNSAGNKDMVSKIWTNGGYHYLTEKKNIVGEGEIARYEQFLLFPQCCC